MSKIIINPTIILLLVILAEFIINEKFISIILDFKIKNVKIIFYGLIFIMINYLNLKFIPEYINPFITIIVETIILFTMFKISSKIHSLIIIIPISIINIFRLFIIVLSLYFLKIDFNSLYRFFTYRIAFMVAILSIVKLLTIFSKKFFKYKTELYHPLCINSKSLSFSLSTIMIISIFLGYYMVSTLMVNISLLILNVLMISAYLYLIVLLLLENYRLNRANEKITYEEISYKNLSDSYDNIREFKHDFSNIMQSIGGYIFSEDIHGLKKYYSSLFNECEKLKDLEILNKEILSSPPVLALINEKYKKAEKLGIKFNIEVLIDINNLHMDIYEFTRVLGIFLDNSIEAASKSNEKIINIVIRKDIQQFKEIIMIENSYSDSNIDTKKIFEKNFTSKATNSGIGLWKVKKILKKYNNIFLDTSVNNKFFKQKLEIYY